MSESRGSLDPSLPPFQRPSRSSLLSATLQQEANIRVSGGGGHVVVAGIESVSD